MTAFFITGAGTEIGKTFVACALLRDMVSRGVACNAFKPVLSGFEPLEAESSDAGLLLRAMDIEPSAIAIETISPWRYKAPLAPHLAAQLEGLMLPYDDVLALCRERVAAARGILLIEGAGGVMAPLGERVTNLDLIESVGAPVVFVAGSYLGAVSHALTGLEVLKARGCMIKAVVVNESADSVGLEATINMLTPHCEGIALMALRRGQDKVRLPD